MQKLLGVSELIGKSGPISVSTLAAKNYVMLYFSASWCGPCKAFTPKLVDFYNKNKDAKNFEIVFVSRDRDEPSFKAYYEHHPWPAVYGSSITDPLASAMKIAGIPTLVVVDAKTGDVVTKEGRMGVMADPSAEAFPWPPGLESTLFTQTIMSKNGDVALAEIKEKNDYIFLYFSASWCGPCKMFTPKLVEFYNKHKETKKFEIIFLSLDRDEASFKSYYEHHPWYALYGQNVQIAASIMKVQGIPSLFVLDAKTGKVVVKSAVEEVMADPEAAKFPWPTTVASVLGVSEVITKSGTAKVDDLVAKHDNILLYFSASWCPPCKMFTPKLVEFYNKHKAAKNFEIIFVSLDRDEASFKGYYEHHPWLAIPAGKDAQTIASKVGIEGIPHLVVMDKGGNILTSEGVENVMEDPEAKNYPWTE